MSLTTSANPTCQRATNGPADSLQQLVCDAALSLKDTPYRHQGRAPGHGLDCIGLVVAAFKIGAGLEFDIPANYSRLPSPKLLYSHVSKHCDRVEDIQPADVLVLRLQREPQHFALYVGNNTIVHAYQTAGKVLAHDLTPQWRNRIKSIHRIKKWADCSV
jgi:cell wall-associated NlpC family hydrolase